VAQKSTVRSRILKFEPTFLNSRSILFFGGGKIFPLRFFFLGGPHPN